MKSTQTPFIRRKLATTYASKKKLANVPKDPGFILTEEYKLRVCENSHLGKKGYTIPKEQLHPDDLAFLYKDLFVKPEVGGGNYGPAVENTAFAVYRENEKKIYLPRFLGMIENG